MAKIWVLDTETKGTGAEVVPLEKKLRTPVASKEPFWSPPKAKPRPEEPPPPRQPRRFKVVDVVSRRVLAEDVDARGLLDALAGVRSLVDVNISVWDRELDRWRLLTLEEEQAVWARRARHDAAVRRPITLAVLLGLIVVGALAGQAQGASRTVWLCRPGLVHNPCKTSLTTTVNPGGGKTSVERFSRPKHPKIDCFYVYPTVSGQKGAIATRRIDPEEREIAIQQASRFSQDCRLFAPMYRQLTVATLIGGKTATRAQVTTAYRGVRDAWRDYLAHDNRGRGFVLIGHSQGTFHLSRLIREEIEPHPALRKRLISAILPGGNILVPIGKDVGGTFKRTPACRAPTQLGCVVAYSSWVDPPPDNALFTFARGTPTMEVLCTNPAALGGGLGALDYYIHTKRFPGPLGPYIRPIPEVLTPWETPPKLYTGRCRNEFDRSWLDIGDVSGIDDGRPRVVQALGPRWGLHLFDINIALGNLVDLVARQTKAYLG